MSGLSWAMRRRLYQQASSQLENGLTLAQVIEDFRERQARRGRKRAAEAAHEVSRQVRDGKTLMAAMGTSLSDLERSVLDAGEKAGQLPDAMRLVLDVRELTTRLRQKLQASFFAPAVYLVTLYVVLLLIGGYIVPQFTDVLSIDKWTGWAYAMYGMGQLAVGWPAPVIFGSLGAYAGWSWWALPRWAGPGRRFFDQHVFPFTVYREITGFSWLMSFVALLRAKVPDIAALEGQIGTASPWLASRLRPIRLGLADGLDLAEAMRQTGNGFPSLDLIDEIGAYAGFDDFTEKITVAVRQNAEVIERQLLAKGMVMSATFTGLMFLAFVVLQLGSNSLSEILTSSMNKL
ncbi:type II secretion system F family protein [Cupriavidus sp. UYPR2.512]|uniref:type II secretion system F family protein n=1 Tax=Cupriavidus sp. UYPR2.512 TaxID=1080187 RepID=UPI0003A051AF|nr:type II secretion system F family protein [Cupriavidus sp. UYPR2.512]UIF89232.1 type II secretion system F family protein [Cupriavidus necator]